MTTKPRNPAMSTHDLMAHLRHMADSISEGDSLEGSITYAAVGPDDWGVHGAYRSGNLMGQGGMVLLDSGDEGQQMEDAGATLVAEAQGESAHDSSSALIAQLTSALAAKEQEIATLKTRCELLHMGIETLEEALAFQAKERDGCGQHPGIPNGTICGKCQLIRAEQAESAIAALTTAQDEAIETLEAKWRKRGDYYTGQLKPRNAEGYLECAADLAAARLRVTRQRIDALTRSEMVDVDPPPQPAAITGKD